MKPKDALDKLLPSKARVPFYAVFVLIGLALSATSVGFASVDVALPSWLVIALAVYTFLGTQFGIVALANVPESNALVAAGSVELVELIEDGAVTAEKIRENAVSV